MRSTKKTTKKNDPFTRASHQGVNPLYDAGTRTGTNPMYQSESPATQNPDGPDAIIVGGGPVGLWTAIQTKTKNPELNILILEKYQSYQRTQELRLDLSVIDNEVIKAEILKKVNSGELAKRGNIVRIPVQTLEKILVEQATKLDIQIERGKEVTTLSDLETAYPDCKVIIGADGAHSKIREKLYGKREVAVASQDVQYIVEFKYQVSGKLEKKQESEFMCVSSVRYHEGTNTTDVTLRMFVDEETYKKLGDDVTFKTPLRVTPPALRSRLTDKLAREIDRWTKDENGNELSITKDVAINKIPLSIYTSKECAKHKKDDKGNERSYFLVGDAAFAVPYFRALNAGLRSASGLANLLTKHFSNKENRGLPVSSENIKQYNKMMKRNFNHEARVARLKNIGVDAKRLLVKFLREVKRTVAKKDHVSPDYPLIYKHKKLHTLFYRTNPSQRPKPAPEPRTFMLSPKKNRVT